MKWAIGTANAAKLQCVRSVVKQVFPRSAADDGDGDGGDDPSADGTQHEFVPVAVQSAVSAQPMTVTETRAGALARAQRALGAVPDADFGVGLEGGIEEIGERYFECGWMCVIERTTGRQGWGSSARFELSHKIVHMLRDEGIELADVMDRLSGELDVRSRQGCMGVLTNGELGRPEAYAHGLIFALAPFLSDRAKYWDD